MQTENILFVKYVIFDKINISYIYLIKFGIKLYVKRDPSLPSEYYSQVEQAIFEELGEFDKLEIIYDCDIDFEIEIKNDKDSKTYMLLDIIKYKDNLNRAFISEIKYQVNTKGTSDDKIKGYIHCIKDDNTIYVKHNIELNKNYYDILNQIIIKQFGENKIVYNLTNS